MERIIMKKYWMLVCLLLSANAIAENYRVTLLRAAPGSLLSLINEVKTLKNDQNDKLVIMRHSQGDHWDLMLLAPQGKNPTLQYNFTSALAFQHTFLAKSDIDWPEIAKRTSRSDMFHIEMFNAAPGKLIELVKQRHMENVYYQHTKREGNVVFETTFGNDMDVFTIGFYKNLATFAQKPELPESAFEQAAIKAGFESGDAIGLYLRELLSSHHDTFATKVK